MDDLIDAKDANEPRLTLEKVERAIKVLKDRSSQELEDQIAWWAALRDASWLLNCPDLSQEGKDAAFKLMRHSGGIFDYRDWGQWYVKYCPYKGRK